MKLTAFLLICSVVGVFSECNIETTFKIEYDHLHDFDYDTVEDQTIANYSNPKNSTAIRLSKGQLGELCRNFTQTFADVKSLSLTNFGINRLEKYAFRDYSNLEELYIRENYFVEIQDDVFQLLKLQDLSLVDNGIDTISDNAFQSLPSLQSLDLSNNNIYSISSYWFKYNPQLSFLDLSYNQLTSLEDDDFSELAKGNSCGFSDIDKSCPSISVAHNQITSVGSYAFRGVKNIQILNLDHNDLYELPYFYDVRVEYLVLEYNEIGQVDQNALKEYPATVNYTMLYGNSFTQRSINNVETYNTDHGEHIFYKLPFQAMIFRFF